MSDIFKEKFEATRKKLFGGDGNQIKRITSSDDNVFRLYDGKGFAEYFEGASGSVYKIKTIDEGITFARWNAYEKLSVMFNYDASLQQLMNNNKKSTDMMDSILLGDGKYNAKHLLHHLSSLTDGIESNANSKYSKAIYFCTIFIIREDEDETQWSMPIADEKIDDWIKKGYDVIDFLLLARSFSLAWVKQLKSEHLG